MFVYHNHNALSLKDYVKEMMAHAPSVRGTTYTYNYTMRYPFPFPTIESLNLKDHGILEYNSNFANSYGFGFSIPPSLPLHFNTFRVTL